MELVGILASLVKLWDAGKTFFSGTESNEYKKALDAMNIKDVNVKLLSSGGNMVKFMGNNIIEPTIIVTKQCAARKDIDKVYESAVDAYVSFFLMVFKVLVSVHKLDSSQALSILANKGFDHENFPDGVISGLSSLENLSSLPNIDSEAIGTVTSAKEDGGVAKTILRTIELNIDTSSMELVKEQTVRETKNVDPITKQVIEDSDGNPEHTRVEIGTATNKPTKSVTVVPIIVKASVYVVDFEEIFNSVEHRGNSASFFTRFLKWKIDLITTKQFLTGSDLVEEYKKNLLNRDNFAAAINKKANVDFNLSTIFEKRTGLNRMVVTYIMSDRELDALCDKIGFDIDKKSEKNSFMDALLAFNITAINDDRDIANVYISAINGFTPVPIKKLTKSYKDTDSIEMLASAMMSNKMF